MIDDWLKGQRLRQRWQQPFYVEVTPGGADLDSGNNLAQGDAGSFPSPQWLNVQPGPGPASSLLLSWMPPDVPNVVGYRVLRSDAHLGPYELIGLSLGTFFEGLDLPRGKDYIYIVQANDAAGNRSANSAEASSQSPPIALYLPLLRGGQ